MTLTTHAIVGAGIASLAVYNPALGIGTAFASHFIIDAIPHWSYQIKSASIQPQSGITHITLNRDAVRDLAVIGSDALFGIFLSLVLFADIHNVRIVFAGACAGMLPDALQFVYSRFKHEPLISLQKFHEWIHTGYPFQKHNVIGVFSQISLLILFVIIIKLYS